MTIARLVGPVLASLLLFSGCKKEQAAPPTQVSTEKATTPADSGAAMPGMGGMGGASGMMAGMDSEMRAMLNGPADSMKAMLPMHRQMAANMLSQMDTEMRSMNTKADPAWTALADSVRADLTRMPDHSAADLKGMMDGHAARMRRLMEMHQKMGGGMKM